MSSNNPQKHLGLKSTGETLWHSDNQGLYWSGECSHLSPAELYFRCLTTVDDIEKQYPELQQLVSVAALNGDEG